MLSYRHQSIRILYLMYVVEADRVRITSLSDEATNTSVLEVNPDVMSGDRV